MKAILRSKLFQSFVITMILWACWAVLNRPGKTACEQDSRTNACYLEQHPAAHNACGNTDPDKYTPEQITAGCTDLR